MNPLEKDEIPMLSATFSPFDVPDDPPTRRSLQYNRTRSASISSMPTNSTEASENESILIAHTGPLRSNRRSRLPQSNSTLYVNRKHDIFNIATQNAIRLKALERKAERYPSSRAMNHNSHPNDENNKTKNEHLLKSGQLGMCNDPYRRFLRNPRVQGAIRYESPYWRGMAAKRIQVAWRYRKKRLSRGNTKIPTPNSASSPNVNSHWKYM